jgi:hypothetical protein
MIPNQQNQYQPKFNLLAKGKGIDQTEYVTIIKSAINSYLNRANPLSTATANLIKNGIGGEWFVFVCPANVTNYDFNLSIVTGSDFLSFTVDHLHFQVCRIKD